MPQIRHPTPLKEMFEWWNAALADGATRNVGRHRVPVVEDDPQCGYFRRRLVRMGPWIEARIWITREIDYLTGELVAPERFLCEVGGERRDAYAEWPSLAGNPISQAQFEALARLRRENPAMAATLVRLGLSKVPMRP